MAQPRRRIVVSGSSGLIGTELLRQLETDDVETVRLVRREPRSPDEVHWNARTLDPAVVEGADAVVNLCGATVGRIPWTPAYRRKLVSSRVEPTAALAEAIVAAERPPRVFISMSAVGYFGDRPGETLTEESPRGTGFYPDLVEAWERASAIAAGATRVVTARNAVVIAKGGGMMPIRLLTKIGLGAGFGRGTQYWPWIGLADEARAIRHLIDSTLSGPVILAGPTPATSDEITEAFARILRRPHFLRVPAFAVHLLGDAGPNLLLQDQHVVPAKLQADGFVWTEPTIETAIRALVE